MCGTAYGAEHLRKVLDIDVNFASAHLYLGWAFEQKGLPNEAIAEIEKAFSLSGGDPLIVGALGHAYAVSGQRDRARKVIRRALRHRNNLYRSGR